MHNKFTGDPVSFELNSADASTAVKIIIKDANLAVRTLLANERVIVDTLECDVSSAAAVADVFSDTNANGNLDADELIASFTPTASVFSGGPSGLSIPIGITPSVKATNAGTVKLSGTGRITIGKSQGQYPNWEAGTTPGQTQGRNY